MTQFMLLLHETPADYATLSAEEIQAIIDEYTAWRHRIESEGHYVGGEKLKDEGGRHLRLADGELRVVDGPYAEAKEIMGGYFTIRAASYDQAVEIARGCPHLRFGGWIELRAIEDLP